MVDCFNIWSFIMIFMDFFLFQRLLYKKYYYEKKKICWQITLAARSNKVTRHTPPFHKEKNSPKLKDCQIFYVSRVLKVFQHWCSLISKRKKLYFKIFYTCIPEIVSALLSTSFRWRKLNLIAVHFILIKYKFLWKKKNKTAFCL